MKWEGVMNMGAKDGAQNGYAWYSDAVKEQVSAAFEAALQLSALKTVLGQIKAEAVSLRPLFFSEKDRKNMQERYDMFDLEMGKTKQSILSNLMTYRQSGWLKLFDGEKQA